MALQINRSSTAAYVPATLLTGEFFYNSADDILYIGNPDQSVSIVSNDPVDIETRLAAVENQAAGTYVDVTEPATPAEGALWYNADASQLQVYYSGAWVLANDPYLLTTVGSIGVLPLTTDSFFQHIRFTPDAAETTEAERFMTSATLWAEQYTGQYFRVTNVVKYMDAFPARKNYLLAIKQPIKLAGGIVNAVSSITYYNDEEVLTTLDSSTYRLLNKNGKGHILPSIGGYWPTDVLTGDPDIITVTYNTGMIPADVPSPVLSAILLIAASMFENRENEVIGQGIAILKPLIAAKDLLHPYKVR